MPEVFNRVLGGIEDLLSTDATATTNQTRDGALLAQTKAVTPVNTSSLLASTATKALSGLSGALTVHACFAALVSGAAMQYASTSQNGQVYRMSAAPASASQPIAMEENDARIARIPSAAIYNALTGSAQTPDYGNAFVTRYEQQLNRWLDLGSGKDGHGKFGALAANSTAPASLDVATAGLLTDATGYTYKAAAYNLSGAIVASAASASTGAITAKRVTMTLPALPTGAMGWRIFRSNDGANWYYVGTAVLGVNYTETASDARRYLYTDNVVSPNTSVSAPGSDTTGNTATLSGRLDLLTLTLTASTVITIASSGNFAGWLDIRVQGQVTGSDTAWTVTGTGANAVNIGYLKAFASQIAGNTSMFVHQIQNATWTTAGAASTSQPVAFGLGADCSRIGQLLSGFGTAGNGTTGGAGGYGGAFFRLWAYNFANNLLSGTSTVNGAAGSAGATNGAGGGGGAGGGQDLGSVVPHKDNGTRNAAGGAGGAGAGTGRGGAGGGGGHVTRRNCYDKASATTSVAGGATGANGGTTDAGGGGGAHYGDGGRNNGTATVATAGQQFDLNGYYDPSPVFAA